MNKKIFKNILILIIFGVSMWLFSNSVDATYLSVKPSVSTANPGQTVNVTITSDCIGKVNLSASNGTISNGNTWVEGSASVTVTVGAAGTTTITATPVDMSTSSGNSAQISASSASISIKTNTTSNTGSSNSGGGASTQTNSGNQGSTVSKNTPAKKSSNANLSNLGIRPNDFKGFKPSITSYNVTVPADVTSVEVYATPSDSKSKVSGTGKKNLNEGSNSLSVTVTAEDGTKKTYTINVTKQGSKEAEENTTEENVVSEESTTDEIEEAKGLAELTINNVDLSPSFESNIYEYQVKYIGEDTVLQIEAKPTDENYVVDITGNEELKEGENIITILVSDKEGNNIATYQITVNKSLVDEEAIAKEKAEKEKQQKMLIIGAVVAVIIIAIIVFLIIRNRRNKGLVEEYSEIPYSELNEENDDSQQYFEDDSDKLKQDYLNGFESNYNDQYFDDDEYEKISKRKHKGKRFK